LLLLLLTYNILVHCCKRTSAASGEGNFDCAAQAQSSQVYNIIAFSGKYCSYSDLREHCASCSYSRSRLLNLDQTVRYKFRALQLQCPPQFRGPLPQVPSLSTKLSCIWSASATICHAPHFFLKKMKQKTTAETRNILLMGTELDIEKARSFLGQQTAIESHCSSTVVFLKYCYCLLFNYV
jgi:hypothetical protein